MQNRQSSSVKKEWLGQWVALGGVGLVLFAFPALGRRPAVQTAAQTQPAKLSTERIVLFSGKPEEVAANWVKHGSDEPAAWKVQDGAMVAGGGNIVTRQTFTDFQLHVEFKEPNMPEAHGQERGNSGVGLQGRYEIQVLDSYGIADPGTGDCGSVYDQAAPLVNACKPPLQWQTYDITYRAPRFDTDNKKTENARVTVLQNGIVIQNNQEILHPTGIQGNDNAIEKPGPILLQDHGTPVEFRNVWVRPLPLQGANHY